jgi:uncharacterized protein YkwD
VRRTLVLTAAAALAVPAVAAGAGGSIPLSPCATPGQPRAAEAGALARLVNATRAAAGRRPLRFTRGLTRMAARRSLTQVAAGRMSHGRGLGWAPRGRMAGENLALAPDPATAMQVMLQSPAHRALLLSRAWRQAGVGAVRTCDGTVYTVGFLR